MLDLEEDVAEMFEALADRTERLDLEGLRVFTSYLSLPDLPEAAVARVRRWRKQNPERSKAYDARRPKDAHGRFIRKAKAA